MATFSARYRFAKSLTDLRLDGFSTGTKDGYLVATRLAYAYSALEALEKSLGIFNSRQRTPIVDFRMSRKIQAGAFDAVLNQIVEAADEQRRPRVERAIAQMLDELESGNVRTLVEGIRNSLFHGKFTPSSSGLTNSKGRQKAIMELADEVLLTADDIFSAWFTKLS